MRISVVIATWNRHRLLDQTLESLTHLRATGEVKWEVLVCDNASTDDTPKLLHQWADRPVTRWPGRFRGFTALHEPCQGKAFALNRLVARAQGDWLLCLDDDVKVDECWMKGYLDGIARYPNAACFGGAINPWPQRTPGPRAARMIELYPAVFGLHPIDRDTPMTESLTAHGANMALRRDALREDPFDTRRGMIGKERIAGEDVQVNLDLLAAGHEGYLLAGAKVNHYIPAEWLGLRRFCQWHAGIGRTWVLRRGRPAPGRLGVPWWAWGEMLRRAARSAAAWRPGAGGDFLEILAEAAQYWGYLNAPRELAHPQTGESS